MDFPHYIMGEGGIPMDMIKTGEFIAKKRKEKNMTQAELARCLFVTDRAVSKWECGRAMPSSSIMLELCQVLGISINELLTGEELEMESYNKQAEQNLLSAIKQKEAADKMLLRMEIVIGLLGAFFFVALVIGGILLYAYSNLPMWAMFLMMGVGMAVLLIAGGAALRIEQKAGYYECAHCHHRHVPTYAQVFFAPHVNRSRYMKCPHCGKRSYQKKVLSEKE